MVAQGKGFENNYGGIGEEFMRIVSYCKVKQYGVATSPLLENSTICNTF